MVATYVGACIYEIQNITIQHCKHVFHTSSTTLFSPLSDTTEPQQDDEQY